MSVAPAPLTLISSRRRKASRLFSINRVAAIVLPILYYLSITVEAIDFRINILPSQKKCIGEHIGSDVLFRSHFTLDLVDDTFEATRNGFAVSVADESGIVFDDKDKAETATAFTTRREGNHIVCVENIGTRGIYVHIEMVWGADAKDYSQIAKMEHLDTVVQMMRHLEEELRDYHQSVIFLRARENRLRQVNDTTSFRVLLFGFINLLFVLGAALIQAYYFRNFFKSKKII